MRWAFALSALIAVTTHAADMFTLRPLEQTPQAPVEIVKTTDGTVFVDFGKDAFGWLELEMDSPDEREMGIHLGEKAVDKKIDRKPGGSIRYVTTKLSLKKGQQKYRVETPADKRNTSGDAIRLPKELGVVLPFRYVEIHNCPVELTASMVRRIMVHYPFDDSASSFSCDNAALNEVWELCKYSIKATTFAGIYVDGDRERIPYEADAYINQLSHYCVDREYALARHTHEYLLKKPTWPTEWKQHSVLMAHADWLYTGDMESIRRNYNVLYREKAMFAHTREDGLVDSSKLKDIVDWPVGERDGFVMSPVNAVVNAFHYRTMLLMHYMADEPGILDKPPEFGPRTSKCWSRFNDVFFNEKTGLYVDGEGIRHSSLHANLFALAFGLVPDGRKPKVIEFIKSRGMACSVYPAQFLLETMFQNGEAEYAIRLMTSDDIRSWRNMIRVGSTITLEAWDAKFKPNLDWNHAWGAAPANIIPRYVLGVRPRKPGFADAIIAPQPGPLKQVSGKVPTIRGPITVSIEASKLTVTVPEGVKAWVTWPVGDEAQEVGAGTHSF